MTELAGEIIYAAHLENRIAALETAAALKVVKKATETLTNYNSTLYHTDAVLHVPVAANKSYGGVLLYLYGAAAAAGAKIKLSGPTGMTINNAAFWTKVPGPTNVFGTAAAMGEVTGLLGPGATSVTPHLLWFSALNGANAGTLAVQIAQNTANVSNVVVYAESYLHVWESA